MPRCCVDEVQWAYFPAFGFDHDRAKELVRRDLPAFLSYSAPVMLMVVERAIHEHPNHVIDLGAGHAAYDDPDQVRRFKSLMASIPNVLLLMPSPDPQVSLDLLPGPSSGMKMNPMFIQHPLKDEVATKVIYTQSKQPKEVLEEAIQWINEGDA